MFKLFKNNFAYQTIEYAVIDIVSKFLKVLFIPALAYLIEKDLLGQISLFMAIIPFITLGIGLNIPNFFRHLVLKKPKEMGVLFSTFIFCSIIPVLITIIIFYFLKLYYYVIAVLVSYLFNLIIAYNFYLLGKDNRYFYLKENLIINSITYGLVLLILLNFQNYINDIYSFALLLLTTSFFAGIYIIIRLTKLKYLNLKLVSKVALDYLIKKNLPLIFHGIAGFGLIYADRFFLKFYLNNEVVANYTVIYSYTLIFSFILISINNNVIPKYYKLLEQGKDKKSLEKKIILFSSLSLLLSFPVYFMASSIVPNNIDFSFWTFFIICSSYFFISLYNIKVNILLFNEKTLLIATLSLIAFFINIILNIFLIPMYGELGAAVSTLISYIALAFLYYIKTDK